MRDDEKTKTETVTPNDNLSKLPKEQLRAYVVQQVLKVNPELKGNRDVQEFSHELLASVRSNSAPQNVSSERFIRVFLDMLSQFEREFEEARVQLLERAEAVKAARQASKAELQEMIVVFLSAVQPGPLTDEAREVLRAHLEFFQALGGNLQTLSRVLRERDVNYAAGS